MSETILLVDDDQAYCSLLRHELADRFRHAEVLTCHSASHALKILKTRSVNVVITDMVMESGRAGYDLLHSIMKHDPRMKVIVLTAHGRVEDAVQCMRTGCFDYLRKGYDGRKIMQSIRKALLFSLTPRDTQTLSERLILSEWDEISRTADRAKKGIALESLCSFLFRTIPGWQRLESRVRTHTEEIDLVILNESPEEFWRRFGTLIVVECKNWARKRKPGRKDFDSFYSKIRRRGEKDCRLGFFISLHGVARTFVCEVDRIAKENVVIVCLQEDDLWRLICAPDRSQFLKEHVASQLWS